MIFTGIFSVRYAYSDLLLLDICDLRLLLGLRQAWTVSNSLKSISDILLFYHLL